MPDSATPTLIEEPSDEPSVTDTSESLGTLFRDHTPTDNVLPETTSATPKKRGLSLPKRPKAVKPEAQEKPNMPRAFSFGRRNAAPNTDTNPAPIMAKAMALPVTFILKRPARPEPATDSNAALRKVPAMATLTPLLRTPGGRAGLIALGGLLVLLPVWLLGHRTTPATLPPVVTSDALPGTPVQTPSLPSTAATTLTSSAPTSTVTSSATASGTAASTENPVGTGSKSKSSSTSPATPTNQVKPGTAGIVTAPKPTKTVDTSLPSVSPTVQEEVQQALVSPDPTLSRTFATNASASQTSTTPGVQDARQSAGNRPARTTVSAPQSTPDVPSIQARPTPIQSGTSSVRTLPVTALPTASTPEITATVPRYVPPATVNQPTMTQIQSVPSPVTMPRTVTLSTPSTSIAPVATYSAAPQPASTIPLPTAPTSVTGSAAPTIAVTPVAERVQYLGYADGDAGRVAVISAGGTTDTLAVGQTVQGQKITEITPAHLTLDGPGGKVQVALTDTGL